MQNVGKTDTKKGETMKELRDIIKSKGITMTFIAKKLGISREALRRKLNGDTLFNAVEIKILKEILNLSLEQVERIFL